MADIEKILKQWRRRRDSKGQWHTHYDDLARVMLPRRYGFSSTTIEGERRTEDIFDGTPMQAARGLANAVGSMLRPKGGLPEIEIEAEEDAINNQDEAKDWFSDTIERMERALTNPKARFIEAAGEVEADFTVFGTGVLFEGESRKNNSLLFQSVHLKDATPVFSDEGTPEGMYRLRRMPVSQVAERFGENTLSDKSREKLRENPDEKIEVLHCVLPRQDGRIDALFAKNLPFMELWLEVQEKHKLAEGGFHEFPFGIPRWDTSSGEDLGRGPGMIALPDSDTLQSMGETILIAGQRAADPPLAAPNDGSFSAVNTFPGGLTYYDVETANVVRGNPFFPIEGGMNLPISRDMQRDTREQIFAAFYRNILNLPVEGPQMTATEVIQRKQELIREVGPVFGRRETDYLAFIAERTFAIMLRGGAFAPIPEILQGQNIRFRYGSVIKRIAMQIEASAAKMWAMEQIELSTATGRQEPIDLINMDELGRLSAEAAGVPEKVVNGTNMVEQIRQARAEAMQAQEEAAMVAQSVEMAKTGAEVGKTISDAQNAAPAA